MDLQGNIICEISGLEKSIDLEYLNLGGNNISYIYGLNNLKKLKNLILGPEDYGEIVYDYYEVLDKYTSRGNYISKIEGLEKLTNLERLTLSCNCIKKIEGLEVLTNLKHLDLSYNRISEI